MPVWVVVVKYTRVYVGVFPSRESAEAYARDAGPWHGVEYEILHQYVFI